MSARETTILSLIPLKLVFISIFVRFSLNGSRFSFCTSASVFLVLPCSHLLVESTEITNEYMPFIWKRACRLIALTFSRFLLRRSLHELLIPFLKNAGRCNNALFLVLIPNVLGLLWIESGGWKHKRYLPALYWNFSFFFLNSINI